MGKYNAFTEITFVHQCEDELSKLFDGMIVRNRSEDCDDVEFACFDLSATSCTVSHESNEEFTFFYLTDFAENIGVNDDLFESSSNSLDYIYDDTELADKFHNFYVDLDGEKGLLEYFLSYADFGTAINPLISYRSYLLHHNMGEYRSLELDAILNIKEPTFNTERGFSQRRLNFDLKTSIQIDAADLEVEKYTIEYILAESPVCFTSPPRELLDQGFEIAIENKIDIGISGEETNEPVEMAFNFNPADDKNNTPRFTPSFTEVKNSLLGC